MAFIGEFDLYSLKLVLIYQPVFNGHPSISGGSLNMGSTEITNKMQKCIYYRHQCSMVQSILGHQSTM